MSTLSFLILQHNYINLPILVPGIVRLKNSYRTDLYVVNLHGLNCSRINYNCVNARKPVKMPAFYANVWTCSDNSECREERQVPHHLQHCQRPSSECYPTFLSCFINVFYCKVYICNYQRNRLMKNNILMDEYNMPLRDNHLVYRISKGIIFMKK